MASRPQRKRRVAERVRVVDAAELAAARARRLDALEADADEEAAAVDADDEYVLSDGGGDDSDEVAIDAVAAASRNRGRKSSAPLRRQGRQRASARRQNARKQAGIDRLNKPLQVVLDEEGPGGPAEAEGGYYAIAAKPSVFPPKPLCSVCGFLAPYTCTRCLVRFCSLKCGNTHEETRCLKFTL